MRQPRGPGRVPIAVALAGALLAGCGEAPSMSGPLSAAAPTSVPTPSSGLGPTRAPSASPSLPRSLSGWRQVTRPAALSAFRPTDVVWTGRRFVVVGTIDGATVALDSTDGSTWHSGSPFGRDAVVRALAAGAGGSVVAVGAAGPAGDRPTIWHSADGITWTGGVEPIAPRSVASGTITVTDVVATGSGWLVVGREDPACEVDCGVEPSRALAWTSSDGLRWAAVPEQPSLRPGGMTVVTRSPVGYIGAGVAARGPAIWTSSDGLRWSRARDVPTPSSTDPSTWITIVAASANDREVVCVAESLGLGPGGAPFALAWSTSDGETWRLANLEEPTPVTREGVTWTADGWLVAGQRWSEGSNGWVLAAWQSVDGQAWRAIPAARSPQVFVPMSVATSGTIDVAVGLVDVGDYALASELWWRPSR